MLFTRNALYACFLRDAQETWHVTLRPCPSGNPHGISHIHRALLLKAAFKCDCYLVRAAKNKKPVINDRVIPHVLFDRVQVSALFRRQLILELLVKIPWISGKQKTRFPRYCCCKISKDAVWSTFPLVQRLMHYSTAINRC